MRDAARDPAVAYAHGELADRYQSASNKAKVNEAEELAYDTPGHVGLERDERNLAASATNETARDFHHEAANRHTSKAGLVGQVAEIVAGAVHQHLLDEAAAEAVRDAQAVAEHEEWHPASASKVGGRRA